MNLSVIIYSTSKHYYTVLVVNNTQIDPPGEYYSKFVRIKFLTKRLLGLSKGRPHLFDRGDCLIEVKMTLIDHSTQMDNDANSLLGLSKW